MINHRKTDSNLWNSHWARGSKSSPHNSYKKNSAYSFIQHLNAPNASSSCLSIIDLGCGNGSHLIPIKETFDTFNYIGIDISSTALAAFRREHNLNDKANNITLLNADINNINISNYLGPGANIIISYGVIAYCFDPFAWLATTDLSKVDKILLYIVTSEPLASKVLFLLRIVYHFLPRPFSGTLIFLLIPVYQVFFGVNNRATAKELLEVNIVPKNLYLKSRRWWIRKLNERVSSQNIKVEISARPLLNGSLFVLEPQVINE